jgi:chromosome segregation ATPase
MGEEQSPDSAEVTESRDPEKIQSEIEQTREQLGDTVEALARKTDVKAQAKQKLEETKASVSEKKEQLFDKAKEASPDGATTAATQVSRRAGEHPMPLAAAGAFLAGFVAGRLTRR